MKTLTKTTFAILFAAVTLTSTGTTALASVNVPSATTTKALPSEKGFNKIWVAGNVKIVLTQSENEGVTVGEGFNAEKTSVQFKGQTLYINSMESGQVTINVAVKDLQRIEAAGSAVVVMSNNFDVKYLQLFLSQSAKVKVNAVIGSLYTVINDNATLKMNGSAKEHTLLASNMSNIKFGDFVCADTKLVPSTGVAIAGLAK
ncbi:hypothetical protein PBAL39_07530 [Pedobacter sp. BAL39]|uniref:GIN domain-containing protein n=1 Tax=Pedobacter sp. BAL39 TaxID=391596 RepID=UPI0001559D49|nr:DUF2807 domain-containing protein [Pedobacter sp. BAL39]EDM35520.1 hypothetical protein PBAL39_07530 [Pedobacter sp. BAL39]